MARAVPLAWWDHGHYNGRPLREHLAARNIRAVFGYLKSRGWSLSAIGNVTGLTAARVSEITSGRRRVTDYDVIERICLGLSIPRRYMGLGYDEFAAAATSGHRQPACVPMDHRELLGAIASVAVGAIPNDIARWLPAAHVIQPPARVTEEEVNTIREVTAVHRRLDAAAGGGRCLASASAFAGWATTLLSAPAVSDTIAHELRVALADLHNLIGWAGHDAGRNDVARRNLMQSLVLARETNTLPLLANGLYRLGRVSLHEDRAQEALHVFGLGQLAAQQAGCAASVAILHTNTAWAYAILGAADQVADSLARARDELGRARPESSPAWTQFALAAADIHGISAVIYIALAQQPEHRRFADRALEAAHRAVGLRQDIDRRSHTFDMISTAQASALVGDYPEAITYGTAAIGMAASDVRSTRVHGRLDDLWEIAAPHTVTYPDLELLKPDPKGPPRLDDHTHARRPPTAGARS